MYPCLLTFMVIVTTARQQGKVWAKRKLLYPKRAIISHLGSWSQPLMLCSSKWSHRNTNHKQAPSNEIYFNEKSIQTPNLIKTIPLLPMLVTSTLVRYTDRCKEKGDDFNQTVKLFPFSLHSSGTQTSVRRRWVTLTRLLETEHV